MAEEKKEENTSSKTGFVQKQIMMSENEKARPQLIRLASQANEALVLETVRQGAVTMKEIVKVTGLSRLTVSKYLAVLEAREAVMSRPVGSARMYAAASIA